MATDDAATDKTLWEIVGNCGFDLVDHDALAKLVNEQVTLAVESYLTEGIPGIWVEGAKVWARNVEWPWAHFDWEIKTDLYEMLHEELKGSTGFGDGWDGNDPDGERLGEYDAEYLANFEATLDCLERAAAEYRVVVAALRKRAANSAKVGK